MIRRKSVVVKSVLLFLTTITCIACNSASDTGAFSPSGVLLQDAVGSGGDPVNSGQGFVFGVAGLYSNDPVAIVDVSFVAQGITPRLDVLYNGTSIHPSRHRSGLVTVTEPCRASEGSVIEYRRISVLTEDGGRRHLADLPGSIMAKRTLPLST